MEILQADLARVGVYGARKAGRLPEAYHLGAAPDTGISGGICNVAALQFSAATPNLVAYEAMFIESLLVEIVAEAFPRPSGRLRECPAGGGLGKGPGGFIVEGRTREVEWGIVAILLAGTDRGRGHKARRRASHEPAVQSE